MRLLAPDDAETVAGVASSGLGFGLIGCEGCLYATFCRAFEEAQDTLRLLGFRGLLVFFEAWGVRVGGDGILYFLVCCSF